MTIIHINLYLKLDGCQALSAKIEEQSTEDLLELLPQWIRAYRRLVTDTNRAVRVNAQAALGCIVSRLKRELAPNLKSLIGSWWMAQHDLEQDVRAAATAAFEVEFLKK